MQKSIVFAALALQVVMVGALFAGPAARAQEGQGAAWSYEGDTGPEFWGQLSPDYALCGSGTAQSPIDIPSSAPLNTAGLQINYQPSAVNIFNNGHTVEVSYDPGSSIVLDSETYATGLFVRRRT